MTTEVNHQPLLRNKSRIVWIFLGSFFLILLLSIVVFMNYIWQGLQPVLTNSSAVRVVIPSGAKITEIAQVLKEQQVIRNETVFLYYVKYKQQGSRFKAGEYEMEPGITITQIIEKFNQGNVVPIQVKRITIPEGLTIPQLIQLLATDSPWKAEVLTEIIENPEQFAMPWLAELPNLPQIKHRLEGYLFPDTYEFTYKATEVDVGRRLLTEMEKKLASLPADWQAQMKEKGLNLHQLLTIASLIEREVVIDGEREIVASVIYNRLEINMALQIDATVQYALDQPKERLLYEDLKVENPYNTYLYPGLPPGPIASPSLSSIRAALYPADTNYFYYVTKKDGTQAHLFAETFNQHINNIRLSEKNEK